MTESVPVIAIDGPGGVGKGTACQLAAARLGWHLLDSGVLYRVTAFAASNQGVSLDDESGVAQLARDLGVRFTEGLTGVRVILDGQDVSEVVRTEKAGSAASVVAALPAVREALIDRQRAFAEPPGLVADGRDMGSVVFPGAGLKIFLTASVEERAQRRYKQLKEKGMSVSLSALSRDMEARDQRDSSRSVAPLKAAVDARVLDSTHLSITEVVETIISWAEQIYPA